MVIAFVVLAIAALVFLFVYNSRAAKRAGKRKEIKEPAKQEAAKTPEAPPAMSIQDLPPEVGPPTAAPSEPSRTVAPRAADRTALAEAESEAHRSASEGDRAYREALRKFAGYAPEEVRQEKTEAKPDPSSDDAYREALRAMARKQQNKGDS
ncbi:hypothetical protein [Paenibacillus sp. FSL W8-0194]|uniref:hypothetical protein n=1 Tax=Paenibacillus sp. FSL W8-0194 TaxID=2921711 RepID=UPI0030D888E3